MKFVAMVSDVANTFLLFFLLAYVFSSFLLETWKQNLYILTKKFRLKCRFFFFEIL